MLRKIEHPDTFRKNICTKLTEIIPDPKKCTNLEKGVYNWALKEASTRKVVKKWDNPYFVQLYLDRLRSVYTNLSNQELVENINNGTIKSYSIGSMTHQEMKPAKWDELIQAKIKRDKNKYEVRLEAATDTFKCRKCHSNKCTYYQMQTRSADEPMTTFVQCIECGNRWKC